MTTKAGVARPSQWGHSASRLPTSQGSHHQADGPSGAATFPREPRRPFANSITTASYHTGRTVQTPRRDHDPGRCAPFSPDQPTLASSRRCAAACGPKRRPPSLTSTTRTAAWKDTPGGPRVGHPLPCGARRARAEGTRGCAPGSGSSLPAKVEPVSSPAGPCGRFFWAWTCEVFHVCPLRSAPTFWPACRLFYGDMGERRVRPSSGGAAAGASIRRSPQPAVASILRCCAVSPRDHMGESPRNSHLARVNAGKGEWGWRRFMGFAVTRHRRRSLQPRSTVSFPAPGERGLPGYVSTRTANGR
jgi:hypothetical protein